MFLQEIEICHFQIFVQDGEHAQLDWLVNGFSCNVKWRLLSWENQSGVVGEKEATTDFDKWFT